MAGVKRLQRPPHCNCCVPSWPESIPITKSWQDSSLLQWSQSTLSALGVVTVRASLVACINSPVPPKERAGHTLFLSLGNKGRGETQRPTSSWPSYTSQGAGQRELIYLRAGGEMENNLAERPERSLVWMSARSIFYLNSPSETPLNSEGQSVNPNLTSLVNMHVCCTFVFSAPPIQPHP